MKLITILIIITVYLISITECQQSRNLINIQILNRTQIIKLNEQNTLSIVVSNNNRNQNEKVKQWIFARNSTNPNRNIVEEKIYDEGRFLSDPSRYQCKPSNDNCDELVLLRSSKSDVGQYMRYAQGTLNHTFLSYLVTGYEAPIQVECVEQIRGCSYDSNTKKLSLKESDTIVLRAKANIWRGDVYEIPAELYFKRDYREECTSEQTEKRVKTQNLNEPAEAIEFSKRCTQTYTKSDNNQKLSIGLRYTNNDIYSQIPIDQIDLQLDIHYGPIKGLLTNNDVNKTVFTGTPITLKCPFDGNPIQYFWKPLNQLDASESVGEKEFILPKNLQPGTYQYQCRAFVDGYSKTSSDSVQFYINVVDGKASLKKESVINERTYYSKDSFILTNLPAIIGGSVGGIVALILIIVLIVFIVRCRNRNDNNNNKKDEVDKSTAKHNNISSISNNSNNNNNNNNNVNNNSNLLTSSNNNNNNNSNQNSHIKIINRDLLNQNQNKMQLNHENRAFYNTNINNNNNNMSNNQNDLMFNGGTNMNAPLTNGLQTIQSTNTNNLLHMLHQQQPYAAIAHAAAAAAASNIYNSTSRKMSYNNPGFYESSALSIQNTGESPPSYDAALQQTNDDTTPKTLPKHYQPQQAQHYQSQQTLLQQQHQQQQQQQQRDVFLNTSNKNLNNSQSYMYNNAGSNQKVGGGAGAASMLQYTSPHINQSDPRLNQQQTQLQYSDVININNRPRNRDPMQTNANDQQTQYTSVSQFTSSKPMIV